MCSDAPTLPPPGVRPLLSRPSSQAHYAGGCPRSPATPSRVFTPPSGQSEKESCAQELVPALSSRLAPSLPALLLPAAAAGPEPYLTTAAKDEDEEAAGAAGGGAEVLRWPWDAADGDDDEAVAAARPGPEG